MKSNIMNFKHRSSVISRLFPVWVMCALSGLAHAAPDEHPAYQIRAAALDIIAESNILWLRTGAGKDPVKIELNTRVFCEPVKYRGPQHARFYQSEEDAKAEKPGKPIASLKLPADKSLILFQPNKDATRYITHAVAEARFPFGSFRVVNFSKDKVRVDMGKKKSVILAGKAKTFAFKNGNNAVPVSIIARSTITGKPRYTRRSSWSIAPTQRELVLLFPNPRNGLIQARHFVDSKMVKEKD